MKARRDRGEDGSALVELSWLGILLLVPMLWIVVSVFEVQREPHRRRRRLRAAGRAYALAPDDAAGRARAEAAARQALADQGVGGAPLDVRITCTPYPHDCHSGTSVITVVISSRVDLPLMPGILGDGAPSFALDSTHSVPIGQFHEVQGREAGAGDASP